MPPVPSLAPTKPLATVADLAAAVRAYRLLQPEQLDKLPRLLERFTDPRGLAAELLKRGWLTAFQINKLFVGQGADLLVDSYVLLQRLAEGGMGQVYRARHIKLNCIRALKIIRKELLNNPVVVGRFRREIEVSSQLDHPNVVHTYDAGETPEGLYIALEYVEGVDLGRLVSQSGPLDVVTACGCIRQAALALQHAHEKGLIHRDIKPQNLMLTPGGVIKLLDLGLALFNQDDRDILSEARPQLTQLGVIVGTVDFMAPEQARNAHGVDIRADLYSLGCTFYALLMGKPPFATGTPAERLLKHSLEPPPPVPHVAPAVEAVIHRLLAKKPEQRYQTPLELVAELDRLLRHPEALRAAPGLATAPCITLPKNPEPLPGSSRNGKRASRARKKLAPATAQMPPIHVPGKGKATAPPTAPKPAPGPEPVAGKPRIGLRMAALVLVLAAGSAGLYHLAVGNTRPQSATVSQKPTKTSGR